MDPQSDEDIIIDFQNGNKDALNMIFHRYKDRILNFNLRMLGNRADAEEVTGDVFLKLFDNAYTVDPNAKFSTWLFTVARNQCLSRLRKRKRFVSMWFNSRSSDKYEEWDVEDSSETSAETMQKKETAKQVRNAIDELPLDQKEALVLREYHQMTYEQISQVLNCSLSNTKILIFRGREQLRVQLQTLLKEGC